MIGKRHVIGGLAGSLVLHGVFVGAWLGHDRTKGVQAAGEGGLAVSVGIVGSYMNTATPVEAYRADAGELAALAPGTETMPAPPEMLSAEPPLEPSAVPPPETQTLTELNDVAEPVTGQEIVAESARDIRVTDVPAEVPAQEIALLPDIAPEPEAVTPPSSMPEPETVTAPAPISEPEAVTPPSSISEPETVSAPVPEPIHEPETVPAAEPTTVATRDSATVDIAASYSAGQTETESHEISPEQTSSRTVQATGRGDRVETGGTAGDRMDYLSVVLAHIARQKRYPRSARREGITGVVRVRFTIRPRGTIDQSEILQSSGDVRLDREALSMLERASPLPPVPRTLDDQPMTLTLPIEFSLRARRKLF